MRAGVITCQLIHGGSAFVLAKNVQKTVNISSKTLKCLVTKTAEFSAQFFTCEEDRHRVRQDCNLNSLFFFSFLNFFGRIFFSDFSDSFLKFTNFHQNLIFFRCCSIMYPWLDFTIFFSHACVYFRLYCSRQCSYSFWHFFLLHEKNFWQHLFFKYISHYYRLSSKQHFSRFCLFFNY